jgi:cold shock CspA family protein
MTLARNEVTLYAHRFDAELTGHLTKLSAPPRRQSLETTNVHYGNVCWRSKSPDRGYAFIKSDAPIDGAQDGEIFVGGNVLKKCKATSIAKGDRVEFTTRASEQKPGKLEIATIKIIEQMAEAA